MATIDYNTIFNGANLFTILTCLDTISKIGSDDMTDQNAPHLSFLTRSPTLGLPPEVKKKYPNTITIVLQYKFSNLVVDYANKTINVSVVFNNRPAQLTIPFDDITGYTDTGIGFDENRFFIPHIPSSPMDENGVSSETEEPTKGPEVERIDNVVKVKFGK